MALGRALQAGADPAWRAGALAPISGPYAFSATVRAALDDRISTAPAYLGYLTASWTTRGALAGPPSAFFRTPYDRTVASLFDGEHTRAEIFPRLPSTARVVQEAVR